MRRLTTIALAAAAAMWAAGCQPAGPMMAGGETPLDGANSAAYLDRVASRPTVSEADAAEGILLLLGEEQKRTFAEAVALLKQRGIVGGRWTFQADRPVTKGRTAYMVYQACELTGGLTLTLTGPSRRYCLKELQYRGFMTEGLQQTPVTGMEYVAILSRADEYRQTGEISDIMKSEESAR